MLNASICLHTPIQFSVISVLFPGFLYHDVFEFCYVRSFTSSTYNSLSLYIYIYIYIYILIFAAAPSPMLTNPERITLKSADVDQLVLQCNVSASGINSDKSVVWVKDGFYIANGLPLAGLRLTSLLSNNPFQVDRLTIGELQGYYHCEVWGWSPFGRYASKSTLLTFEGKRRCTVKLPFPLG